MRMPIHVVRIGLVAVAVVALAACGGDGTTGEASGDGASADPMSAPFSLEKARVEGYAVFHEDGRLWVFAEGSEGLAEFEKSGEPAKSTTLIGVGPGGISVRSTDIPRIERVSREVTQLLEQGIPISSDAPLYYYTKLADVKIDMLAEAAANARERALKIVEAAGGAGLGKMWAADMGVININPANSTATSWEGNNDKSSYEKDIITIAHVTYELP